MLWMALAALLLAGPGLVLAQNDVNWIPFRNIPPPNVTPEDFQPLAPVDWGKFPTIPPIEYPPGTFRDEPPTPSDNFPKLKPIEYPPGTFHDPEPLKPAPWKGFPPFKPFAPVVWKDPSPVDWQGFPPFKPPLPP